MATIAGKRMHTDQRTANRTVTISIGL